MRFSILVFLAATIAFLITPPAHAAPLRQELPATEAESTLTIPIEVENDHIYLTAQINGKSARFLLDSGAGAMVLNAAALEKFGLSKESQKITVGGAKMVQGTLVMVHALRFADKNGEEMTWADWPFVAIPFMEEQQADGILGYPLFSDMVVTVDYLKKELTFREPDKKRTFEGAILPIRLERRLPHVKATIDGIEGTFVVDTGNNGTLDLEASFIKKYKLTQRVPARAKYISKGVGGFIESESARIPTVTLGGVTLKGVVADLLTTKELAFSDQRRDGYIGGEVLRRFTVTFDYPNKRLILQPNADVAKPFEADRSGLSVSRESGYLTVIYVVPGSPADTAGIHKGDIILAMDGQSARDSNSANLATNRVRAPAGTVVEFLVRSGASAPTRTVKVILRDLL